MARFLLQTPQESNRTIRECAAECHPTYLMPHPPYRMWAFGYNATAGGPTCVTDEHHRVNCSESRAATSVPVDQLFPAHSYNLLNPGTCYPKSNTSEGSTALLSQWLASRGVACMAWEHCWNVKINPNTNDSAVIADFRSLITRSAERGATAIGLDECGDLVGSKWGHLKGDIPGEHKMALAAEGFRQGKKLHPELFVAAWNPGDGPEPDGRYSHDGIFSGLMKDGTFNLAMFEVYTHNLPRSDHRQTRAQSAGEEPLHISQWYPRFNFARREGWLNRSIPCLGMLFGKSDLNPTGWTKAELRATMQELKDKYPEMPGIGFCECSWPDFVLQPLFLIHD